MSDFEALHLYMSKKKKFFFFISFFFFSIFRLGSLLPFLFFLQARLNWSSSFRFSFFFRALFLFTSQTFSLLLAYELPSHFHSFVIQRRMKFLFFFFSEYTSLAHARKRILPLHLFRLSGIHKCGWPNPQSWKKKKGKICFKEKWA